jgi:hypothetical protein
MPIVEYFVLDEAAALAAEEAARLAAEEAARQAALETAQQTAQEQAMRQTAETAQQTALETAQQTAQEQAVRQTAEEGIKQAAPQLSPAQEAYRNASTASLEKGIGSGVEPFRASQFTPGADPTVPQTLSNTALSPSSTHQVPEALKGTAQIDPNMVRPPPTAGDINLSGLNSVPETNPFMKGLDSAWDWVKNNKMMTASLGMNAMNLMNKRQSGMGSPEPYNGILTKYKMSPDFQGRQANPQDFQYTPKQYAEGGIMGYKSGGIAEGDMSSFNYYKDMLERKPAAAPERSDVGIYYDQDPDTRYQDALTAAQIRQAKVNRRANMQLPGMKRPTPMGQLNLTPPGTKAAAAGSSLDPENAAQGGIMNAGGHLGGYATGGNPRLLKGPGDGMSDDIPATIANKQPARLADGEFVVPADVVSHLGNGSTEAGAKKLHDMMTNIRKARTGNPKQGKQINPNKFLPK